MTGLGAEVCERVEARLAQVPAIGDSQRDLDEQCAKTLLRGQGLEQAGKTSEAIQAYKEGQRFFPDKQHECFQQLKDRLNNLE